MTTEDQTITIVDNPAERRFEISLDGVVVGLADYTDHAGVRSFVHTEIEPAFGGRGLASRLIRAALDETREAGLQVLPFCPFVRSFIAKHRDYADLVPAGHRARFDLEAPDGD